LPAKLRLVRYTNTRLQERRALARRGLHNRPGAVRIERCSATSETTTETGRRQPAVVRESRRQQRAFLAERGCSSTTGGLRPPLLVVLRCGHLPAKLRLVRYTNTRLQERRASARRGSVTGRASRTKRITFGERRPPNQERRASARRGSVTGRASRTKRIMFGERRPPNQERRPSARRGVQNRPGAVRIERCSATSETTTETGRRQPAVVRESRRQH
jgi:hypothetical protein